MTSTKHRKYGLLLYMLEEKLDEKGKERLKDAFADKAKIGCGIKLVDLLILLLPLILFALIGTLLSSVCSVVFWIYVGSGAVQSGLLVWEDRDSIGLTCFFKGHKWRYPYEHSDSFAMMCHVCYDVCTLDRDEMKKVLAPYASVMSTTELNI